MYKSYGEIFCFIFTILFCFSMDLLTKENVIANEKNNEDIRNNSILQVLKDMSRKRNYTQVIL